MWLSQWRDRSHPCAPLGSATPYWRCWHSWRSRRLWLLHPLLTSVLTWKHHVYLLHMDPMFACKEHPHPVPQVPGLCHEGVPKKQMVTQHFPPLQPWFLRQRSLYPHPPCPLGRIPSWIYFCRFACLGMKGICRGRAAIGWGGGAGAPQAGLCGSAGDLSREPAGSRRSGASPGHSRGVFQDGLSLTSLSERGELGFLFLFLGSAFGTVGWLRPWRPPDSHLGETDKGRFFCQQNPAQFPWNRAGRGGGALWRKDREVHQLPI